MKKKKNNVNNITIIAIIIVLLVLCLSIGWSSFNSSMRVDSVTMVRVLSDIRVTGFRNMSGTNSGISQNDDYNVKYVNSTITLPYSNSTVRYKVEITNMELASNTHMGINSMTGLPNSLKIVNIEDYTLKDKICDDDIPSDCGSGAQKTFYITIGYENNAYNANNTTFNFAINFDFKQVYDINYSGFTNPPITPTSVIDGETPTIVFNSDAVDNLTVISGGVTLTKGVNYTYSNHIMTFISPIHNDIYIYNPTSYTITYELDGGTQANNQVITYSIGDNRTIASPTKTGYIFGGWYLNSDLSGDEITNTNQLNGNVTLYASWVSKKARINGVYYDTLKDAVEAVSTNNQETVVELLGNTSEIITVAANQNIILDLKDHTLSNKNNNPVIANNGTLTIYNGTITSSAQQGAINNQATGVLNITGGSIMATGSRQALYNNGGRTTISGSAYLSATTNQRAAVQNLNNGTITITGGTIVSTGQAGVENDGTLTIGIEGSGVNTTSPTIRGQTHGVVAITSFDFFDGRISGKTSAIDDETKINDMESNYELLHKTESIGNVSYKSVYLALSPYEVIFDPTGGTVDNPIRQVEVGGIVGPLETPTRAGFVFDGWYDDDNDGHEITQNETINSDKTFYAHWIDESIITVARIGTTEYQTLTAALATVQNNTQTTIVIIRNISLTEKIQLTSAKNIIVDLNGHTIDTTAGTVFENYGRLEIKDSASGGSLVGGKISGSHIPVLVNKSGGNVTISGGTISSNISQVVDNSGTMNITGGIISIGDVVNGALNNNAGATLNMSGGTIIASIAGSKRQAVYNKGTVNISGTAVLTSASTDRATVQNDANGAVINISGGTINSTNSACERGAVQNINKATVNITGGTIISNSTNNASGAVQNAGTLVIGTKDGVINATSPELRGETYGVNNTATFKFYDGVLKGKTDSINGNITETETNSSRVDTMEGEYHKTYLN